MIQVARIVSANELKKFSTTAVALAKTVIELNEKCDYLDELLFEARHGNL